MRVEHCPPSNRPALSQRAKGRSPSTLRRRSSPFTFPPSPLPRRSGISLLEILISIGVLSIGLLGVASLIPIGKLALVETNKSDRSGACGRAALREIKARRMLDTTNLVDPMGAGGVGYTAWPASGNDPATYGPMVVDPLGVAKGLGQMKFGGTRTNVGISLSPTGFSTHFPLPRLTRNWEWTDTANPPVRAEQVFRWHDDLLYVLPKDYKGTATNGNRPMPAPNPTQAPESDPSFSWFFTVMPMYRHQKTCWVSAVVCYKRDFSIDTSVNPNQPAGEQTVDVAFDGNIGYGGGTLTLSSPDNDLKHPVNRIKDNQWVLLIGWKADKSNSSQRMPQCCQWYRVVGVNRQNTTLDSPVTKVTVVGSDWNATGQQISMVVVDGVIGVYSAMIRLDEDAIWSN